MDRRKLLKLIGLAPVAAPVVAQSALASGGLVGSVSLPLFGEAIVGETLVFGQMRRRYGPVDWLPEVREIIRPGFSQTDTSMQDDDFNAEFSRWMPDGVETLTA